MRAARTSSNGTGSTAPSRHLGLRRHKAEQAVPNGRNITLLWIAIASYTAVHMLFYVIFRYREPIMPLVCVLAAVAIEQVALRWRKQPEHQTLHA